MKAGKHLSRSKGDRDLLLVTGGKGENIDPRRSKSCDAPESPRLNILEISPGIPGRCVARFLGWLLRQIPNRLEAGSLRLFNLFPTGLDVF